MLNESQRVLRATISWQKTAESAYVFNAFFEGKEVRLRLNDFPDEPLCTLFVSIDEIQVDEFPKCWTLPRHRGEQ